MHDIFRKYINNHISVPVSDEEFEGIEKVFIPKKLRKKQYLLQEGDVCKYLSFIIKGAMRQYTVDEKGVEHIVRFGIENWWMADRESFTTGNPTAYNIDAIEDCELLTINNADWQRLPLQSPAYAEMNRQLEYRGYVAAQKRIHAAISLSAEERYTELSKANPEFLQRFSQSMIASYLGVSPETLSRIRKQALSK